MCVHFRLFADKLTEKTSTKMRSSGGDTRKRNLFDSFQRFMDLDSPKSSTTTTTATTTKPTTTTNVIDLSDRGYESVNAKWEGLQYFEERINDSSYGSLASSSSSESSSSRPNSETSKSNGSSSSLREFLRLKKDGWKRLKSQLFRKKRVYKSGSNVNYDEVSTSPNGPVDMTPSGLPEPSKLGQQSSSSLRAIRSSRSMQNLEQITRESYFNLRDATNSWKQKYHSRAELREGRPRSVYQELGGGGDSDDEGGIRDDDEEEAEAYDDLKLRGIR